MARPWVAVRQLGRAAYASTQTLQHSLVAQRRAGSVPDMVLLVEHPPVFTLGRVQASRQNLLASAADIEQAGATVHQSDRGGNVTFHGPGQLVAYPILDLNGFKRSLRWYVSSLEDVVIRTAAAFGVQARPGDEGETGVWVEDRKLAAIGIHVTRWVTSHGCAINADVDLRYFEMIVPLRAAG